LAAGFFVALLFLAAGFDFGLLAFLAAGAPVELLLLVDDLLLDFAVPLAAFFFGDAAFFFGLLALPPDFGLAFDFDAAKSNNKKIHWNSR